MSMPTKEQWAEFERRADSLYNSQKLTCDGYELTVCKQVIGKNSLGIMVYVNGVLKGIWFGKENPEHPEQRFMRPSERYVHTGKFRASMLKILGKRRYAKENYDRKVTLFYPDWSSAASLRRHLIKSCQSITMGETITLDDISKQAQELRGEIEGLLNDPTI